MLLRALIYGFLAYMVLRVIQATSRVMRDGGEARRDRPAQPPPRPPAPPAPRTDFKDVQDADFTELPPDGKKEG
jgi:hypothetical protein